MSRPPFDDDTIPPAADPYGPSDGTAPSDGGVGGDPLRADELRVYGSDQAAGSDIDDGEVAGTDVRAWYLAGWALLVAFLGLLAWAVLQPLL